MPEDGFFHTASPAAMQEGGLRVDLLGEAKAPERCRDHGPHKDHQAADRHLSGNRYHSHRSGTPPPIDVRTMNLFQKNLLAPAALGLMAPVAASASELNIAGVSQYGPTASRDSLEQVTSITQFSDVQPTDWAYQALSNLIERYGCVAGYPNGTYRSSGALTRLEAAALLNACLDRITEVTDELKRLMKEFENELAVLRAAWMASRPRWLYWKPPSSPPPASSRVWPPLCWVPTDFSGSASRLVDASKRKLRRHHVQLRRAAELRLQFHRPGSAAHHTAQWQL